MAKQKSAGKKFIANVLVTVVVGVSIPAKTLEEALTQARSLRPNDCIEVLGENVDWNHDLIGVSSDDWINY